MKLKKFDIHKCISSISKNKNIAFIFNAEDKIFEFSNGKSLEETNKWIKETLTIDFDFENDLTLLLGEHLIVEFDSREELEEYIRDRKNCGFFIIGYSDGKYINENT